MTQHDIGSGQSDGNTASQRVVSAVADAREKSSLELPPLYEVIDPDALDSLFDSSGSSGKGGPGRVVFMFDDCEVVVHSDGEVDATAMDVQTPASSTPTIEQDESELMQD